MLSFIQMAAALSGAGNGDDTLVASEQEATLSTIEKEHCITRSGDSTAESETDITEDATHTANSEADITKDLKSDQIDETDNSEADITEHIITDHINKTDNSAADITTDVNTEQIDKTDNSEAEIIKDVDANHVDAPDIKVCESSSSSNDKFGIDNDSVDSLTASKDSRSSSTLKKYLIDNDFSREGSVDVDSLVHSQLDSSEVETSPDEKSWDEELREALIKQDKDLEEIGIYEAELDNVDTSPGDNLNSANIFGNDSVSESVSGNNEYKTVEIDIQETDNEPCRSMNVDVLDEGLIMPETREDMGGAVSPSLMFASCRYRWERAIITESKNVVFVTINKKDVEPIKLGWSDSSKCYYSEEFKIPVGTYVGNLVIDGTFYPVEDITIKHYTFEVDIYLKDEIIDDEQGKANGVTKTEQFVPQSHQHNGTDTQSNGKDIKAESFDYTANKDYTYSPSRTHMDSDRESATGSVKSEGSGINLSSKYQELVRSQMSYKNSFLEQDFDKELGFSIKSDLSDLDDGRRTPVGEDGAKQYQDGDDNALKNMDLGNGYKSPGQNDTDFFTSVLDKEKNHTPDRKTPTSSVVDDVLGTGHARTPIYSTETPVHSRNNSAHSSARQTPLSETREFGRPESVNSNTSALSVSRHLIDDLLDNAVGTLNRSSPKVEAQQEVKERSLNGSLTKTPPPAEQIDDVLNPADRHSPIRRDYLNGSPRVSNHSAQNSAQNSVPGSANNSQRQTPQKDIISDYLQTSQEKLYSSQDIRKLSYSDHGSSPHGSHHSSQLSSHHSSQLSSQHSSQHSSHHSSLHSGSSSAASSRPQSLTSEQELTQYYENLTEAPKAAVVPSETITAQRSSSASSLPVIGTQRYTAEKRSMTPDNHIRIPGTGSILKGPLLPGRTTPRTPLSNASSRTVTPVNAQNDVNDAKTQEQMKDLENTVSSLRRLLASREQEVVEVKGQFEEVRGLNHKLQGDIDRLRARASPGPQIAEFEKKYRETLQERDRLTSQVELMREELKVKEEPSLNSYDPNGRAALQRKIDDLTSQIQDHQEAHEITVSELHAAEKKVKELAEENERLRILQNSAMRGVEDDNRLLKTEVSRLKENRSTFTEATEHRLKIELHQVKEDNRSLRERNYTLHDDTLKLKEEIRNLRKSFELMGNGSKTYNEDKKAKTVEDYIREDRSKLLEGSSYHSGSRSKHDYHVSDPLPSYQRSDTLPKDENDHTYTSYSKTSYDTRPQYDSHTESLSTERTYDLESDLLRMSSTDHLSRSDGGRYQKSNSYGNLETDRLAQTESIRYNSDYRSMPDGGVADRLRPSPPKFESRQERSRTLGSSKKDNSHSSQFDRQKYDRLDCGDLDFGRKERSRTSSAEVDYRSSPAYNSDLTKTMPILSGRSKEIYEEITDKRLKERSQCQSSVDSTHISKSELDGTGKDEPVKTEQPTSANSPASSAQVFVNRYIPQNSKDQTPATTEDSKLLGLDREDVPYTRANQQQLSSHTRHIDRDEKDYEIRGLLYQDDGDMSDTATDILVNAQPLDKIPGTWNKSRARRGSLGSEGSDFSDIDEQLTSALRKRSKSADGREVLRRMAPTGSSNTRGRPTTPGKGERTLSRTMSPGASTAGFRTVTPRPLATQHNKTSLSIATSMNTLTQGLRPFAPRSPQDLQVNDVIKFSRQGGKLSQGTIKFIGHLPGRGDIYLGVELDKEDGKHDGIFEDVRYFKCKPSKGVFVAYNKVVMAWTSY